MSEESKIQSIDSNSTNPNQRGSNTIEAISNILKESLPSDTLDSRKQELKRLKRKFSNALKKKRAEEKTLTKELIKDVNDWKKKLDHNIHSYYTEFAESDLPYVNDETIDALIERYKNQQYINKLDKKEFCELLKRVKNFQEKSQDPRSVSLYQEQSCEKLLEECEAYF